LVPFFINMHTFITMKRPYPIVANRYTVSLLRRVPMRVGRCNDRPHAFYVCFYIQKNACVGGVACISTTGYFLCCGAFSPHKKQPIPDEACRPQGVHSGVFVVVCSHVATRDIVLKS
jgi:hypothetical protein